MKEILWKYKSFAELSTAELYDILKLRSEVFVVEQNCVYLDMDNRDQVSGHLCGWLKNIPVAYARIIPPAIAFKEASIGRVSTAFSSRNLGLGRILMIKAIDISFQQFSNSPIRIGAQLYLQGFYASLGFISSGAEYLEDGIPHIEMFLSK